MDLDHEADLAQLNEWSERPSKRAKLLSDDSSESSEDDGGVAVSARDTNHPAFKINEKYARRFEHNKKREEIQRLEEKYGKAKFGPRNPQDEDEESESYDSSEDESEDDEGILATKALDAEILATLDAIRKKDPRVYDPNAKFYTEFNPEGVDSRGKDVGIKMTLRDYHTKNLLEGRIGGDDGEADAPPLTRAQEQEQLKRDVIKGMHEAMAEDDTDDDDFLVVKSKPKDPNSKSEASTLDVGNADKDPDTFLSNFFASRAWVPAAGSRWQAFESDDEGEEQRAEDFENAWNMRFEHPDTSRNTLQMFSRTAATLHSVRKDEKTARQRKREVEKAIREEEKKQREEEKARLRKLKIEEMEEKVQKIKEAAGLSGKSVLLDEWADVLEEDFNDDKWEQVMTSRFGDSYYALHEGDESDDETGDTGKTKRKMPKKPTWDDDIDIKDLVPTFSDEEGPGSITLTDDELGASRSYGGELAPLDADCTSDEGEATSSKKRNARKERETAKIEAKRQARKERRMIEALVDQNLDLDLHLTNDTSKSKNHTRFHYREVSPGAYGLNAKDILLADDAQLNEFAGLKKLAPFRDPEKKQRDRKKLSKKGRLRKWRKDVFGHADGPSFGFGDYVARKMADDGVQVDGPPSHDTDQNGEGHGVDIREGERKKRKRGKKKKVEALEL